MSKLIRKLQMIGAQFGVDIRRMFLSLLGIPRYIGDWINFRRGYKGRLDLYPCLVDWYDEGGATSHEYFWQDLYVARKIHQQRPIKHVDIGSRIDGFVAHLASFRDVEVFDIRPISTDIPGIQFKKADFMSASESLVDYCDSLSCLHALEHFGLGRYGDKVDPKGYLSGLENMAKIIKTGGLFYLSVPVGEDRVEFNAHRIFDPQALVRHAAGFRLGLKEFAWVETSRAIACSHDLEHDMSVLSRLPYTLGIFTFEKLGV